MIRYEKRQYKNTENLSHQQQNRQPITTATATIKSSNVGIMF